MPNKDLVEYKKKYDLYRYHAWAGGILLSLLLAIRALLEISNFSDIPDFIILPIGFILVVYVSISIIFTYKYRAGLNFQQDHKIIQVNTISDNIEKERLKLEKKKVKSEVKKQKKVNKKIKNGKNL